MSNYDSWKAPADGGISLGAQEDEARERAAEIEWDRRYAEAVRNHECVTCGEPLTNYSYVKCAACMAEFSK